MSFVARRPHAIFSILALFVLSAAAAFGDCGALVGSTTSFNFPGPLGDWGTAAEWSTLSVPNSTTSACIINGTALVPTTVTLAASSTGNVLSLEVDANNTLTLANNSQLNVYGTKIINGGSININSTGSGTLLLLESSLTLSGAGTLTLQNPSIIEQGAGGLTLTNQSTIQGAGTIGNNGLALTNSGTVDANSSGNVLTLNGGTITNTGGTLEATGGGILNIIDTAVTNGNITASGSGSTVNINTGGASPVITGATLTSTGGGVLQTLATQYASFSNITLTTGSTFTNGNDAYMYINGTITNQGTINIASGTTSSILWLSGNTTLTGGGTVTLSGAGGAFIDQTAGGLTLTNTNNTIQATGTAFIGNNGVALINQATVEATGAGAQLILQGPQTNNAGGTLEATNSGTLNIANSVSGGLILANGGTVNIDGSSTSFPILNATLTSENGGTLQTINAGYADFDGVTLTAGSTYTNGNNAYLYFNNTITNNGTINIAAANNDSILWMNNNVTLTGTGTLELSTTGAGGTALIDQTAGGLTLTNQETIAGAGIIGSNNLAVINQATINANTSGQILELEGAGGYTNTGAVMEATNNGILEISGTTVNNFGGQITTGTGGIVQLMGSGIVQGGTLSGNFETINTDNFTLDGSTNGALTFATGSTYNVDNDSFLYTQGSIVNNGQINLNAGANNTDLILLANTTLSGTGTLNLSTTGAGVANLLQNAGGLTLTNQETIDGAGAIGANNLSLTNQGIVNANVSGQTLVLEGAGTFTNTSTLEATGGGILEINGATINNSGGGIIQTNTGGIVQLMDSGTVQGGTLSGNFETINTENFTLDGSTHGALTLATGSTYNVDNDSFLYVTGGIVNNGQINLNAGANNTDLIILANTTLSGTGTLNLSTTGAGVANLLQNAGGLTLTNQETIDGAGAIGANNLSLTNQGIVNANVSGQTLVLEGAGTFTNTSTLEATGGGILEINGATINNSGGGIIQTNTGGIVQLMGSGTVQGGTLSGNFETINSDNFTLDGAAHGALTFSPGSTYNVGSNSDLFIQGSIVNNGAINITAGASDTVLEVNANNTTLSGTGTLTLGSTGAGTAFVEQTAGGLTLINQETIQGTGVIGNNNLALINGASGTLLARNGDSLTIEGAGGLTNNGIMQVNAGGTMTVTTPLSNFSAGTLTGGTYIINGASGNNGTMQISLGANTGGEITTNAATIVLNGPTANTKFVDAGGNNLLSALATNSGSLTLEGGYNYNYGTSGTITNSGTLTVGAASTLQVAGGGAGTTYSQTGGTTEGTGTIIAANSNINGGALLPGASTANPGTLSFTGNLSLGASGSLSEGITGAGAGQFGLTNVSGSLNVNGSAALNIFNSANVESGAAPIGVGTQLTIMTSSGLTGAFSGVTSGATFDNGKETWTVADVGNNVVLNATPTAGFVTATWAPPAPAGNTGIWTTNTEWTCDVPVAGNPGNSCVPNNGTPAGVNYAAVMNSPGNTLTLGNVVTVNSATMEAGTLVISAGATLNANSGYSQTGGTTNVEGTLTGATTITGGTLEGSGGLVSGGDSTIGASATLLPGTGPATPGTLNFGDNINLNGTLDEVLNGSAAGQFGTLSAGFGIALNSSTSVLDILGTFSSTDPAIGTMLKIATAGAPVTGSFSNILNDTFNSGAEKWVVLLNQSGGDNIELEAESNVVAGVFTATWSTGNNNWTNATAWTCNPALTPCVPNNGTPAGDTYAAILNSSGNTLTLDTTSSPSSITVNSVDIQNGTLAMNGSSLTALNSFTVEANGSLSGNGTIVSPSFTNNATVNPDGVTATGGTLDLSGSTITNLSGTTLNGGVWAAGGGGVAGTLKLPGDIVTNNSGLLFLDQPGSEITDPANANALAGLTSNNSGGHLAVFDGATLAITPGGGTFTNSGSFLNASFGGSALTINGNLTNSGGSDITVNGNFGGATLTVNGNLNNLDTSTIELSNSGLLAVSNPAGPTITNNGTISDGGTLSLTDSGNGKVGSLVGTGTLTLQGGAISFASDMNFVSTSTINGNGTISGGTYGVTNFDNQGTLAPTTGTITLNSDFNNDGQVTVTAGNTLAINASSHVGNSTFQNATILINGGTLTDNSFLDNGLANGFTGTLTIQGGGTGTISGALNNGGIFAGSNGVVTITGAGSSLTATGGIIDGGCAVGCGTGTINVLAGGLLTSGNQVLIADGAGSTGTLLINGANSELNTTGNDVTIGTGGTVTVSGGGTLLTDNGNITNSGTVTVGNGGTISMGTGDYTQNAGTTTIDAGGIIDPTNFMVNGGTTQVDGSLTATTVSVANGAELTGNGGTITGNLVNDGTLSPGTGVAPGTLTVNGNVTLNNDGTFLELIAGLNNFGVLTDSDANGIATLGGTLELELLGGYRPVVGNTFTFIDPFADNGIFTALDLPAAPAGDEYIVAYDPGGVQETELCFVSSTNPVCGAPGTTPPPAVPEPKSVVLLGTVIAAALWIHRKRRQKIAAAKA